jgi:hypothetical protein
VGFLNRLKINTSYISYQAIFVVNQSYLTVVINLHLPVTINSGRMTGERSLVTVKISHALFLGNVRLSVNYSILTDLDSDDICMTQYYITALHHHTYQPDHLTLNKYNQNPFRQTHR